MTVPPEVLHGTVTRVWRTPRSEGCTLAIGLAQHTLYGPLPPVTRGATLRAEVKPVRPGTYEVVQAERVIPESEIAWHFYRRIQGFAAKAVPRLIEEFGSQAHAVVRENPGFLRGVKGIPPSAIKAFTRHARREGRLYTALRALADQGLPPEHARGLLKAHGAAAPTVFFENPYRAILHGVPLRVLDHAARLAGIRTFDPRRSAAVAAHVATSACTLHGHTALPGRDLLGLLRDDHALDDEESERAVADAVEAGYLKREGVLMCLPRLHHLEQRLATDAVRLLTARPTPAPPIELETALTEEQSGAVELACTSPLSVITGGPGTGKTTTLKALLDRLDAAGLKPVLCAPTGKAASRMQGSTGREATTLHRLLGSNGEIFTKRWLTGDVFVVDEVSMASSELLGALLAGVPTGSRVVLVGDEDQLPPIDPGHPLAALTRTVPTARLTKTHRQAADSPILTLATQLISGEPPVQTGVPFIPAETAEDVARIAEERVTPAGPPVVLTAGKAGPLGTEALNLALQEVLNPGGTGVKVPGGILKVGDPVMVTRNNHATGLMNGMTGRVTDVQEEPFLLRCEIDGRSCEFGAFELSTLTPAYAITIHRSQGSEWPSVIVALSLDHASLLSRQLAYTGVTRAKTHLVATGTRAAWRQAALRLAPVRHSPLEGLLRR